MIDEAGALLAPLVRRTLAPRGKTPLLSTRCKWREKVSMIAALGVRARSKHLSLHFRTYKRQYINNEKAADFLRQLLRRVRGKIIVVWDGGNMHKGDPIRQLLARTRRLQLERLPAYSPEFNPAEYIWKHLKFDKMANFCPLNVEHIDRVVKGHLRRLETNPEKLGQFLRQSKLPGFRRKLRHCKPKGQ